MFALAAFIVFIIVAIRDWSATAPAHQIGLIAVGLALIALHLIWDLVLPGVATRRRTTP